MLAQRKPYDACEAETLSFLIGLQGAESLLLDLQFDEGVEVGLLSAEPPT